MKQSLHIEPDGESLAVYARDWLVKRISERLATSPSARFALALSGGSTPQRLYQLLAQLPAGRIDWRRVWLLWGDERNVAADHDDSNYRMVREHLLDHIDIPLENVLAVPQSGDSPQLAAARYEELLRTSLPIGPSGFPCLDCVLLGMGEDVHTASLFPGTQALQEKLRWVVANHVPKLNAWRITFSAPMINHAHHVVFLLSGNGKQQALDKLWHSPSDAELYPSKLIRPSSGRLWFLVDQAAIDQLPLPSDLNLE